MLLSRDPNPHPETRSNRHPNPNPDPAPNEPGPGARDSRTKVNYAGMSERDFDRMLRVGGTGEEDGGSRKKRKKEKKTCYPYPDSSPFPSPVVTISWKNLANCRPTLMSSQPYRIPLSSSTFISHNPNASPNIPRLVRHFVQNLSLITNANTTPLPRP